MVTKKQWKGFCKELSHLKLYGRIYYKGNLIIDIDLNSNVIKCFANIEEKFRYTLKHPETFQQGYYNSIKGLKSCLRFESNDIDDIFNLINHKHVNN